MGMGLLILAQFQLKKNSISKLIDFQIQNSHNLFIEIDEL